MSSEHEAFSHNWAEDSYPCVAHDVKHGILIFEARLPLDEKVLMAAKLSRAHKKVDDTPNGELFTIPMLLIVWYKWFCWNYCRWCRCRPFSRLL